MGFKEPFEVADFSGGMTDNQFGGDSKTHNLLDNFTITSEKKLLSRAGSNLDDAAHSPIPTGNTRVGSLINYSLNDKLFLQAGVNVYFRPNSDLTGAWQTLLGPSGNAPLSAGGVGNFISHAEWNKQLFIVGDAFNIPVRIFKDQLGVYQVRNAGLPLLASIPTATAGAVGSQNFVYAFAYEYKFQVNTQSFEDLGPTSILALGSSADPSVSPNTISNIPVLTNNNGNNFDLGNINIGIYRTINNGTNFYRIGTVTNGTTTFTDSFADSSIQTMLQLYINDGTLDYYAPPSAKYISIVGNVAYYGNTVDSFGTHIFRVHQSIPGNPALVPALTYGEVQEEVTGLGQVKGLPLLFCKKLVHRIDGTFTSSGTGSMNAQVIHATAGCISHHSVLEAENYCFWAGNDGFYASDGYQVIKITDHLNTRYQAMLSATANKARIQGKYDPVNRLVYWTVQSNAASLDNDSFWVLDLKWGISVNSSFTTFSGNSFRPSAIEVFQNSLIRGDTRGFVFKHDQSILTDPKVVVTQSATAWPQETIVWNYQSNQYNFGGSFFRKFVSRILIQAANAGNTSIQINAINDQGKSSRALKIIRWLRNFIWGDDSFTWGNPDCIWDATGLIEQWRRFPAKGLRLSYLQIQITNGFSIIADSDQNGSCVLNTSTKMATLSGLWPRTSVDYFVSFANDNYTRQFQVSQINTSLDTVTLLDPQGKLPVSGSYQWQIAGLKKGEPLNLLGYNLHWTQVDQNQNAYQSGDSGGNNT